VADSSDADKLIKRDDAELPAQDPIVSRSTSGILLISALLLTGVLAWALYDEAFGQRPWKTAQREFVERESRYLQRLKKAARVSEQQVKESEEYNRLAAEAKAAREQVEPEKKQNEARVRIVQSQLDAVTEPFQDARGALSVINYRVETAHGSDKDKYRKQADQKRQEKIKIDVPADDGSGKLVSKQFTYTELQDYYNAKKAEKAEFLSKNAELLKEPTELEKKRADYLKNNVPVITLSAIDGLLARNDKFDERLNMYQINVPESNIVDRCKVCHLGVQEPLELTPVAMHPADSRKPDEWSRAFVSHPNKELQLSRRQRAGDDDGRESARPKSVLAAPAA
jgi:hypothetical protein